MLLREKARTGRIALGAFYLRRALRILPLYYAVLLSYLAFALCLPAGAAATRALLPHAAAVRELHRQLVRRLRRVAPDPIFVRLVACASKSNFMRFGRGSCAGSRRAPRCWRCARCCSLDYCAEHSALGGYARRILTSFAAPIGFGALLALLLAERRAFDALFRVLGSAWSAPLALAAVVRALALAGRAVARCFKRRSRCSSAAAWSSNSTGCRGCCGRAP